MTARTRGRERDGHSARNPSFVWRSRTIACTRRPRLAGSMRIQRSRSRARLVAYPTNLVYDRPTDLFNDPALAGEWW